MSKKNNKKEYYRIVKFGSLEKGKDIESRKYSHFNLHNILLGIQLKNDMFKLVIPNNYNNLIKELSNNIDYVLLANKNNIVVRRYVTVESKVKGYHTYITFKFNKLNFNNYSVTYEVPYEITELDIQKALQDEENRIVQMISDNKAVKMSLPKFTFNDNLDMIYESIAI